MNTTKTAYKNYLSESFDLEAMKLLETSTPKERAVKFLELIKGRHNEYNVLDNTIQHLQGLGEYLDINFLWYDIKEQAKDFGLTEQMMHNAKFSKMQNKELALENVENLICEKYFATLANYIHQMAR